MSRFSPWALVSLVALSACPSPPSPESAPEFDPEAESAAIEAVLDAQAEAWNAGDFERYMELGYVPTEALVFTSGGKIRRGYDETVQAYRRRYPDQEAMGRLTFSDLEITLTGPSTGVALGRWALDQGEKSAGGVFTLVFVKTARGWRILHDHTSSDPKPDAAPE